MGQKWLETLLVKSKSPEDVEAKKPKQRKSRRKWKFWKSSVHASDEKQQIVSRRKENYGTEEWAAIVIQTAFRVFLARRAFRAIKGLVRLQALVRGRKVRKQASITLRCMQTLVKVHSGVRARQAKMISEVSAAHIKAEQQAAILKSISDLKGSDKAWLDSVWTKEEIVNRIQEKQIAAMKRARALNYAHANQWRAHTTPASEHSVLEWGWLERWMASRPWENHVVEEALKNAAASTLPPKNHHIKNNNNDSTDSPKKNTNKIETTMVDSPKKAMTKTESFDSPKKKNGTVDSPKIIKTLETPKKSVDSPKIKTLVESPHKVQKIPHKDSDSFDSPKSVQSNSSKFSPQVTPTKVVNGVVKPVVKSRYMNPRKVPRAESNPKERPSLNELDQQKRRLSLPTPRAKELSKTLDVSTPVKA